MKRFISNIEINSKFVILALVLLVALCGLMSVIALNSYQVLTYRPIEVQVTDKRLVPVKGRSGRRRASGPMYRPVVDYRYTVGYQTYTGDRVTPLNTSGSRKWAEGMLERFHIGERYQGYYNPLAPSDAYLVRYYSPGPFCALLPVVILLLVMLGVVLSTRRRGAVSVSAPVRQPDGWYAMEHAPPAALTTSWVALATVWYGVEVLVLGPYFLLAYPDYDSGLLIGALLYALIGAGLIILVHRGMPPPDPVTACVAVDTDRLVCGAEIGVRVEVRVDYTMMIEAVEVGLSEQGGDGQRPATGEWIPLAQGQQMQPHEPLRCTGRLTLPDEQEPNGWNIVVRVRSDWREYRQTFPLQFQSPPLFAAV